MSSSDKSSQKKYYGTTSANKKIILINTTQLHIKININGKKENTIIDSGAIGNFITKNYIEIKKHSIQDKKQFYGLVSLNNILLENNSG